MPQPSPRSSSPAVWLRRALAVGLILAAPSAAATAPSYRPSLCVEIASNAASRRGLTGRELRRAIRARLATRRLRVHACRSTAGARATWRASVEAGAADLLVVVEGRELSLRRSFAVDQLEGPALIQLLALSIVEDVRPALDRLLAQLGITTELAGHPRQSKLDQLVEQAAARPANDGSSTEPLPQTTAVPAAPAGPGPVRIDIAGGLVSGFAPLGATGYLELAASLGWGEFEVGVFSGAQPLAAREAGDLRAGGATVDVGALVRWRWRRLVLGLRGQARFTVLGISSLSDSTDSSSRTFTDGGLSLAPAVHLWQWGRLELALATQLRLWWQPRRFLVGEQELRKQSLIELWVGPVLRVAIWAGSAANSH